MDNHSDTSTRRRHNRVRVSGLDTRGTVVGLIDHIAHYGQFVTVIAAIVFLVDGDILRLGEGRGNVVQHRDGLHLVVGGITAIIYQMPRSRNDLLALTITIRHHIRVGGLNARGAVVGLVDYIASHGHRRVKAAIRIRIDGVIGGSGERGFHSVVELVGVTPIHVLSIACTVTIGVSDIITTTSISNIGVRDFGVY